MRNTLALIIAATVFAACGQQKAASPAAAAPVKSPAPAAAAPAAAPGASSLTGKVLESFNGGGYTYLRLATASGEEWAAIREASVPTGETVTVDAQMTMEKFQSPSLNRTFDRIVFGTLATGGAAPMAPTASPAQHMQAPAVADVHVEKASGGVTVAEVWAQKSKLNNTEVVVRGKVVKFRPEIMGVNWVHIQDGSGSPASGNNDLTVTTSEVVKQGDTVTVKGTVAADKDFGAGYKYPVIVEKARIVNR
jgi:hypothetical protein